MIRLIVLTGYEGMQKALNQMGGLSQSYVDISQLMARSLSHTRTGKTGVRFMSNQEGNKQIYCLVLNQFIWVAGAGPALLPMTG